MAVKREFEPKFKRGEHDVRELLRVYLVTDEALCVHHDLLDIVQMAVRAGVTCVQLREKHLSTGAFVAKARALKELLDRYAPDVPLLINDRVDVALAAGADGTGRWGACRAGGYAAGRCAGSDAEWFDRFVGAFGADDAGGFGPEVFAGLCWAGADLSDCDQVGCSGAGGLGWSCADSCDEQRSDSGDWRHWRG